MLDVRSPRSWCVECGTSFRRELQCEAPLIDRGQLHCGLCCPKTEVTTSA